MTFKLDIFQQEVRKTITEMPNQDMFLPLTSKFPHGMLKSTMTASCSNKLPTLTSIEETITSTPTTGISLLVWMRELCMINTDQTSLSTVDKMESGNGKPFSPWEIPTKQCT